MAGGNRTESLPNFSEILITDTFLAAGGSSIENADGSNFDLSQSLIFGKPNETNIEYKNTTPAKEREIDEGNFSNTKRACLSDGTSVYLEAKERKKAKDILADIKKESTNYIPMDELFGKVELRQDLKRINETQQKNLDKGPKQQSLWTEKYRPQRFVDLCSAGNDKQYRMMMHWLRKFSSVSFGEKATVDKNTDPLGRPYKKFLLINGPVGIGKTASTHVIAKQLGFSVQELNASNTGDSMALAFGSSDPGSVARTLKLRIINALTSNSLHSKGRPTCLVIDEIDSSPNCHEIVKVLQDLNGSDQRALAKTTKWSNKVFSEDKNKRKRKLAKEFLLNRPIILIANDIYNSGSSLRNFGPSAMDKLRSICEIITFRKPAALNESQVEVGRGNALRSIKEYLISISRKEKLGTDYQQISDIVATCESDIRACINYLQFNSSRNESLVPRSRQSNKNNKDGQLTWIAAVEKLFKRVPHLSKEENFEAMSDLLMSGSGQSVVNGILDKIIKACFSSYLDTVYFQDDSLVRPSEFSDWLALYDTTSKADLDYCSSLVFLKVWSLFSDINARKFGKEQALISNSRGLDYETFEAQKQNRATIHRLVNILPISYKLSLGSGNNMANTLVFYFLPLLNEMILSSLYDSKKKAPSKNPANNKIAEILRSLNVNLEMKQNFDTTEQKLDFNPNWQSLISYTSVSTDSSKSHLLNQQNGLRILLSELERFDMSNKTKKRSTDSGPDIEESMKKRAKSDNTNMEFIRGKYDLMSRQGNEPIKNQEKTRVWIKYNEGFSNAVRKDISWKDIWI